MEAALISSAEEEGSGAGPLDAADDVADVVLSVAADAGDAENLAAPDGEAEVPQQPRTLLSRQADALKAEHLFSGGGVRRFGPDRRDDVLADHQMGKLPGVRLLPEHLVHNHAVAHDDDPVRNLHDLLHLVGDEDHAVAFRREILDEAHQVVGLLRREHRRGLVHDEDAGVDVEGL